jgi:hypothetical protein
MMELMLAKIASFQKKMDPYQKQMKAMLEACLEKTEVYLQRKEPTPEETKVIRECQEIPKEQAAVEIITVLEY